MKIEIENPVKHASTFKEVNTLIHIVKGYGIKNIDSLSEVLKGIPFRCIEFGFGSDHMWVKEVFYEYKKWYSMKAYKRMYDERIIIVTND